MSLDERDQRMLIGGLRRYVMCECPRSRFQCWRCEMLARLRIEWPDQYEQVLTIEREREQRA